MDKKYIFELQNCFEIKIFTKRKIFIHKKKYNLFFFLNEKLSFNYCKRE